MLTCLIRYRIEPAKRGAFDAQARKRCKTIPRCGADLLGCFAPHEGSTGASRSKGRPWLAAG